MVWKTKLFSSTGQPQEITLYPGAYKFECWGAQGGSGREEGKITTTGGKGAYASGILLLERRRTFYVYVGEKGSDGSETYKSVARGGWNGGGNGGPDSDDDGSGGGGGASDVRLVSGEWNLKESLVSRIIVASGGSGSAYNGYGAPGGALTGYISSSTNTFTSSPEGSFGVGENGRSHSSVPSSGAGGGYFGGKASDGIGGGNYYKAVSSSGTSYVSGFPGCTSVNENGEKTQSTVHYSKLEFLNQTIKDGREEFDGPDNQKETGHSGNGYVRITRIISTFCTKSLRVSHKFKIITSLMMTAFSY